MLALERKKTCTVRALVVTLATQNLSRAEYGAGGHSPCAGRWEQAGREVTTAPGRLAASGSPGCQNPPGDSFSLEVI